MSNTSSLRWAVGEDLGDRIVNRKNSERTFNYSDTGELSPLLSAYEEVKKTDNQKRLIRLIGEHRLTHEMIPNKWKDDVKVWEAMLQHMPVMALIRNLNKMTSVGLVKEFSSGTDMALERLSEEAILKSRVHPLQILVAVLTYSSGEGVLGSLTWRPVNTIVDHLQEAFYVAFDNVVPTNKNTLLALDISSSMGWGQVCGSPNVTPAIAASAMALVTARVEKKYQILGFNTRLTDLKITARDTLESAYKKTQTWTGGGTDCATPILHALSDRLEIDTFVIYTDSETWHGRIHPKQAFDRYRQDMNKPDAKFIVVGMEANEFSIAHPEDPGMLDLVGFDTASPNLISSFARGELS
jgi:60 kDa SS-A/Ro ribonucleoprotein